MQTINPNVWMGDYDAPHGQCLNSMDVENLRHFVQDYAVRALIPYVEHLVGILNEAVSSECIKFTFYMTCKLTLTF